MSIEEHLFFQGVEIKDYYCYCSECKQNFLAMSKAFVREEPYHSWLLRIDGKTAEQPYICRNCYYPEI